MSKPDINPDVLANIVPVSNFVLHSVYAHGVLMSIAFVILFPLGALTVRLFNFKGLIWVHAGLQILALAVALAAFGLGVANAAWQQLVDRAHPINGILVIALLFLQPLLGLFHHYVCVRSHRRTLWAHAHIWFGRGLIVLGIINGGLGMRIANNTTKGEIAYGVIAGVVLVIYVGINLFGDRGSSSGEAVMAASATEKSASSPAESQGHGQIA